MLNDTEKEVLITCAHKYGATELYVFGSALGNDQYNAIHG
jgi:predicted nucleotidyltransferase